MKVKLSRWGNSLAVRIPSPIAEEAQLREGASLDIERSGDGLRLTPIRQAPTLEELVTQITEENRHDEADWGKAVGKEAW